MLWGATGSLGLQVPGVYRMPYSCGVCYSGQVGWTVLAQCGKHDRNIFLKQPEKSALAEHCGTTNHWPLFDSVKVLGIKINEVITIHSGNLVLQL